MKRPAVLFGLIIMLALPVMILSDARPSKLIIPAAVSAAAGIVLVFFKRFKFSRIVALSLFVFAASAVIYCVSYEINIKPAENLSSQYYHSVSGTVSGIYGSGKIVKTRETDGEKTNFKFILYGADVSVGDEFYSDNVVFSDINGSRAYVISMLSDSVIKTGYADSFSARKTDRYKVKKFFLSVREKITLRLQNGMNDEYASISDAVLTGNTDNVSRKNLTSFRRAGVSHLFAVSGLHLTLWVTLIVYLLNTFTNVPSFAKAAVSAFFVVFFMFLTGFSPSVLRAGIMTLIFDMSLILGKKADSLNSLFIALSLILIVSPFSAVSAALWLSFLASLCFILLSGPVRKFCEKTGEKIKLKFFSSAYKTLFSLFILSLTVTVFTLPVTVFYFGSYSLWAPLSNVLCVIPAEMMMVFSGLGVIFYKTEALMNLNFLLASVLAKYLLKAVDFVSGLKFSVIDADNLFIKISAAVIFSLLILSLFIFGKKPSEMFRSALCLSLCLVSVSLISVYAGRNDVRFIVSDAGQGAVVTVKENGRTFVIGSCGTENFSSVRYDISENSNKTVDFLLATNPAGEQKQYFKDIAREFTVKKAVSPEKLNAQGNISYSSEFSSELDSGICLNYINNKDANCCLLEIRNFKLLVIFDPSKSVPSDFISCDAAVCSNYKPSYIDENKLDAVIISTDSKKYYYDNIFSTKFDSAVEGKITGDGKLTLSPRQ